MDSAPNAGSHRTWAACLVYATVFTVFAWRWLRVAGDAVPQSLFGNPTDERLVASLLAWGARALFTHPLALFQMPINHPAPDQLAGSEHLLSTQLVFAPTFWLTGNAVLAANAALFAAYPLGATAMYWLLCGLGCDRLVAFCGGFALVLGAAQVPAHLHQLQYLLLYFPLVAGMLSRLRLEPSLRRAIGLAGVALLAFFSSYYTFVLTAVVAAIWGLAECCGTAPGRRRFIVLASAAFLVPTLALAVFSLPYVSRPEIGQTLSPLASAEHNRTRASLAAFYSVASGPLLRHLAGLGLVGLVSGSTAARLAARRGLALAVVGGVLMLGPAQTIAGMDVPLPFALFAMSPLRFLRYPFRFVGVLTFGRALLVAAGLQAARQVLPHGLGRLLLLGVTTLIVATRAPLIAGGRFDTIVSNAHPAYDMVARLTQGAESGPLLELPVVITDSLGVWNDGDALIGQIRHGLPLVAGHTGYQPPHRALVEQQIAQLPAPSAIRTLVDLTHVRWLLLRPRSQWPQALRSQRDAIAHAPWATVAGSAGGWLLLRVVVEPRHEEFYAAIARGWHPGLTALGTPVAPIPALDALASVTGELPKVVTKGRGGGVRLLVTNHGQTTWPVSVPTFARLAAPYRGEVYLQATWRRLDAGEASADVLVRELPLPYDIPGQESVTFVSWQPTPPEAGRYAVELAVRQRNGEGFSSPASQALRGVVDVR